MVNVRVGCRVRPGLCRGWRGGFFVEVHGDGEAVPESWVADCAHFGGRDGELSLADLREVDGNWWICGNSLGYTHTLMIIARQEVSSAIIDIREKDCKAQIWCTKE